MVNYYCDNYSLFPGYCLTWFDLCILKVRQMQCINLDQLRD
jgi:hypothetical protein